MRLSVPANYDSALAGELGRYPVHDVYGRLSQDPAGGGRPGYSTGGVGWRRIREAVRCGLQLIANHPCLLNCPMQPYHQNGFAHSSDGGGGLYIDSCALACSQLRLREPVRFIQAGWIRPEDLAFYERMGFDSFKLLERNMPSAELLRRVRAYGERRFEGNLADLILPYGFAGTREGGRWWRLRYFFRPRQVRPARLRPLADLARMQGMMFPMPRRPIRIEAAKIPADFLSRIERGGCGLRDCESCGVCGPIAEEAVTIDETFRERVLTKYDEAQESILSGRFWDV